MYLNIASYLYGKQIKSKLGNTVCLWIIFICVHLNRIGLNECRTRILKASAHSFKRFTSRLLKLSSSLSFYAPITSDECHAWFHLNAASPDARNTDLVNITKNLVHGRIWTTNTARPPDFKSTALTTRPPIAWYEMELNVREIYIYSSMRSINKHVNLCRYTRPWYNICIVLQFDICRYFIIVFNNIHMLQKKCRQLTLCWCVIHVPAHCSNTKAHCRDISSVLFCKLINVDILLLFLTIFIHYKAEIDILLMQYTHAPFQIIYR